MPESSRLFRKILYGLGAIAALLAVFVFRRNLGAELALLHSFGLIPVPETLPVTTADWLTLLREHPWVGMTLLGAFDLVETILVGIFFLSLSIAFWHTRRRTVLLADACSLSGIAISFYSNQAFSLLTLSRQYASSASETHRLALQSAGENLLTVQEHGTGVYSGLFLVLLSGLIFSVLMLRDERFGKAAGVTGILANGIYLLFFPALAFGTPFYIIPPVLAAPFRMAWYFISALKLWRLSKEQK